MDTKELDNELLHITPGIDFDKLLEVRSKAKTLLRIAKEIVQRADNAMLEHIEATGGKPIVVDELTYFASKIDKKTSCRDAKSTLNYMLANGDIDSIAACITTQPFKHGEFRKRFGEEAFNQCFNVTESPYLEEGKPTKKLVELNNRFLR